ncbi:hypothetical protein GPALN_014520 [Globodera pallida]|nr:hypothetical protein GPALN_014520 [Globodera pallida]
MGILRQFGIVYFLSTITIFKSNCDLLKHYSVVESNDTYHITQVMPPGKYRVIIWDLLIDPNTPSQTSSGRSPCHRDELFCFYSTDPQKLLFYTDVIQFRLNELDKCFLHFYTVDTDDRGQFLLKKNSLGGIITNHFYFYLMPLKGSVPISDDHFAPNAAQQIFYRKDCKSVDSLCDFVENRCLIKYFETQNDWEANVNNILDQWFLHKFYRELSDKSNFFLIAHFKYLLDEAVEKESANAAAMATDDAKLLGIFWNKFAEVSNVDLLWKRLRLANEQMMQLFDQFCQIDKRFLLSQRELILQLGNLDYAMAFCQQWFVGRINASNFVQENVVMDAFHQWIHTSTPINFYVGQIVLFWIELLTQRTATNDVRFLCQWPELDQNLFRQIGVIFNRAKSEYAVRFKTLNRIRGINELLDGICTNINNLTPTCCGHNAVQMIMQNWKTSVCNNGKVRHSSQNSNTSAVLHQNRQQTAHPAQLFSNKNDKKHETETECVICMTRERRVAFDPCGHRCVCKQCAQIVEKNMGRKCPICCKQTVKTLRIYDP